MGNFENYKGLFILDKVFDVIFEKISLIFQGSTNQGSTNQGITVFRLCFEIIFHAFQLIF